MATRSWNTDEEYSAATSAGRPMPTDTPYRTPSRTSRNSRRSKRSSNSPGPPSSSPPLPYGDMQNHQSSRDVTNDESISILDPRRFTPTLHASLVSEILGLRRDQEEKIKIIESLESELHGAGAVRGDLEQVLASNGKEKRSLKRQLDLLEGGTSSALQELTKERDEAVDSAADLKRRLESVQKKQRSQKEDLDRTNDLYSRDKESWDAERRKYERQIHVAEGRLKGVLDEIAAVEAARRDNAETETQELTNSQDQGNDNASVRSMSITNSRTNSIRFSAMNGFGNGFKGISLADELNLDTDDDQETDYGGCESAMSNHNRHLSRDSIISSSKNHRRNMSNDSLMRSKSANRGRYVPNHSTFAEFDSGIPEETAAQSKPEYIDTGVQFSPPPSPKLESTTVAEAPEINKLYLQNSSEPVPREWEVEANQRRKRVYAPPLVLDLKSHVVSAGCQTLDLPLSPPRTPQSPTRAPPPPPVIQEDLNPTTASISTQTDLSELTPASPTRLAPQLPPLVPMISIHPPESRPSTPRGALLPAHFKNAECQVFLPPSTTYCSSAMQTEEIRVDQRLNKLPPHLHPSAISSGPLTSEHAEDRGSAIVSGNMTPVPPRDPRRVTSKSSIQYRDPPSSPPISALQELYDAYPGNNDDGPLSNSKLSSMRRPHRISSLFAGFDDKSSDDGDFAEGELSDNEFRTALSAPKPRPKSAKRTAGPTSVPEDEVLVDIEHFESRPSLSDRRSSKASSVVVSTAKQGTIRKAALILSGVAAHANGSLSTSLEGNVLEPVSPPFPIPNRASSRQPHHSSSVPSEGRRSPTSVESSSVRNDRGYGREYTRSNSTRKARSTTGLQRNGTKYRRRGSRSPPPLSVSTEGPASPQLPPMPSNDITSPRFTNDYFGMKSSSRHRQQPSSNTAITELSSSNSNVQTTSVVDSIAQTMVGEWMFKYVRRRKSFGVPDNNQVDENSGNGVRHKRWVWLAPYERAVMWSSKQPTSGSALLGKTGRKLTIQSVLDVKDDNPRPKGDGGQPMFNRSILILTPARALKFTAISSERHYIWLTALSFLAHSSQAVPKIQATPPPIPPPPFAIPPKSPARFRKNMIRDSIRVAKGKPSPTQLGVPSDGGNPAHYGARTLGDNVSNLRSLAPGEIPLISQEQSHASHVRDDSVVSGVAVPLFGGRGERDYDKDRGYQSSYANTNHSRKRSNTASRVPPPLSFRGFSSSVSTATTSSQVGMTTTRGHGPQPSTAGFSIGTNGSSDIYGGGSVFGGGTLSTGTAPTYQMSASGRSSDVSGSTRPGIAANNFFDAVGTVRMEAFISPMALMPSGNISRFDNYMNDDPLHEGTSMNLGGVSEQAWGSGGGWGAAARDRDRDRSGRRRKSRHRDGFYGSSRKMVGSGRKNLDDFYSGSRTAGEEDFRDPNDLFRGF